MFLDTEKNYINITNIKNALEFRAILDVIMILH